MALEQLQKRFALVAGSGVANELLYGRILRKRTVKKLKGSAEGDAVNPHRGGLAPCFPFRHAQDLQDIDRSTLAVRPQPEHAGDLVRHGLGKGDPLAAAKDTVKNSLGFGEEVLFSAQSPWAHPKNKGRLGPEGAPSGKNALLLRRRGGFPGCGPLRKEQYSDFAHAGIDKTTDGFRVDHLIPGGDLAGTFLKPAG